MFRCILIPDASQCCFFSTAEIYDFQSLIVFNNLIQDQAAAAAAAVVGSIS